MIACPVCGRTSFNPNDEREGYCGNCHDWTRPGPAALEPGLAPGGIVVQVYDLDGRLLIQQRLPVPDADIEFLAEAGATAVIDQTDGDVVLVMFDGDSGERVVHPDFPTGSWLE